MDTPTPDQTSATSWTATVSAKASDQGPLPAVLTELDAELDNLTARLEKLTHRIEPVLAPLDSIPTLHTSDRPPSGLITFRVAEMAERVRGLTSVLDTVYGRLEL